MLSCMVVVIHLTHTESRSSVTLEGGMNTTTNMKKLKTMIWTVQQCTQPKPAEDDDWYYLYDDDWYYYDDDGWWDDDG